MQRAFASSSTTAENSINDHRESFRCTACTAVAEYLGYPRRVNANWFDFNDPAIETLLGDNRAAFQERHSNPQSQADIQHRAQTKLKLQRELRHMGRESRRSEALSDRGDSRGVFQSLKSIYGPRRPTSNPMLTADGNTLLTSKRDILSRWKDYYATLLNRPSETDDQIREAIQQCPIRDELNEFPKNREIEQAIASIVNTKAAGLDGIPAEVYKHGGDNLVTNLLDRHRRYWESGELLHDFKDVLFVNIYTRKGGRQDCGNYLRISLMVIASKLFAKILRQRLLVVTNDVLPEALLPRQVHFDAAGVSRGHKSPGDD